MEKKRLDSTLFAILVLVTLIVVLLGFNSIRRSAHIELPDAEDDSSSAGQTADGSAVNQIAVAPDTVQKVIATLRRSPGYTRVVTVTQYYGANASGETVSTVSVQDGWTRIDARDAGGTVRHALTDGETTYVWYGSERTFFSGAAGDISADAELGVPTYEDILSWPVSDISEADYEVYAGVNCIRVKTNPDESGRVSVYWVSVASGLLSAAEVYDGETLLYRMSAPDPDGSAPDAELFVLPDGTALPPSAGT